MNTIPTRAPTGHIDPFSMPPRFTPPPKSSFFPSNDQSTYRDLWLFEERLKTNASSLKKRKARYQLFLVQLLAVITFLLWEVLAPSESSVLAIPYTLLLQRVLPDIYPPDSRAEVHPYLTSGLLFVSVTTLVLFFASGMYSEKIAYANKYVPHANKALRSFNMYLNVRKPPLRSKFYLNPLSFFFPRPHDPPSPSSARNESRSPTPRSSRSLSPEPRNSGTGTSKRSASKSTSIPISPIPPASNPRGELIFSSRVDRAFREAYERYRAALERRREEKDREKIKKKWWGRLFYWVKGEPPLLGGQSLGHVRSVSNTSTSSSGRGRGSRSGTPPGSASGSLRVKDKSSGTPPSSPGTSGSSAFGREGGGGKGKQRSERSASPSRRFEGREEVDMRTMALERSWGLSGSGS